MHYLVKWYSFHGFQTAISAIIINQENLYITPVLAI